MLRSDGWNRGWIQAWIKELELLSLVKRASFDKNGKKIILFDQSEQFQTWIQAWVRVQFQGPKRKKCQADCRTVCQAVCRNSA